MTDKRTEELTDELIKEATFVATRTMGLCLTKEFGDAISKSATEKERARIMAIIEAKKKMYSESNGLVYVLDIILKEIESKKED